MDADDDDTLTYTLGGADATSFGIERCQRSADDDRGQRGAGGRVVRGQGYSSATDKAAPTSVDVTITVGGGWQWSLG